MGVNLSTLSVREKLVLETTFMHLSESEAIQFLKEHGHEITLRTYYRDKKKIEESKYKRLESITLFRFEEQHMERLEKVETIERQMWECAQQEDDPSKKANILEKVGNIQPILSAYYEASKKIYQKMKSTT
ncbi:MAG: hypothetical protein ACPKPY_02890 [Nitrososphaeraceae archaeon]